MFGSVYVMSDIEAIKFKKYSDKITYKNKQLSKNEQTIQLLKDRIKKPKKEIEREYIIIDDKKFLRGIR